MNTTMNRNSNTNTYRERRADGSAHNPNPHGNRNTNGSRDNRNPNRSPNTSRDNRDSNPFQRNNRPNYRSNDSAGYQSWKHKPAPQPPKEKVLGPEDFPSLPSISTPKPKAAWSKPEVTLAEKVREVQEKEEEAKRSGRNLDEKEEDKIDVIPLSAWMRSKYLAKQREENDRRREIEEEEENYRWQISRAMFPPKPEPEMPEYNEDAAYDEELDAAGYEYTVDEAPMYEDRI
jgi:hypothetical protein